MAVRQAMAGAIEPLLTTSCKTCAGKQGNLRGEPGVASDSAETPQPGIVRLCMELAWVHSRI